MGPSIPTLQGTGHLPPSIGPPALCRTGGGLGIAVGIWSWGDLVLAAAITHQGISSPCTSTWRHCSHKPPAETESPAPTGEDPDPPVPTGRAGNECSVMAPQPCEISSPVPAPALDSAAHPAADDSSRDTALLGQAALNGCHVCKYSKSKPTDCTLLWV